MTKEVFLNALRGGLANLPANEIDDRVQFYSDMIDDRVEEGVPEEEAVAAMGSVDHVLTEILSDVSITKLVKQKVKPKRRLRGWEIALIIIGSPIWFALLIALIAVIFSFFTSLWATIIGLFAGDLAIGVSSIGLIINAITNFIEGNIGSGIFFIGWSIAAIGLAIFMFIGCIALAKLVVKLIGAIIGGTKRGLAKGK